MPVAIGILGPSQSGKSELLRSLQHYFNIRWMKMFPPLAGLTPNNNGAIPTDDAVLEPTVSAARESAGFQDADRGLVTLDILDTSGAAMLQASVKQTLKQQGRYKFFILCYSLDSHNDFNSYEQMLAWLQWIQVEIQGAECVVVGLKEDTVRAVHSNNNSTSNRMLHGAAAGKVVMQEHGLCAQPSKMDANARRTFAAFADNLRTRIVKWHTLTCYTKKEAGGLLAAIIAVLAFLAAIIVAILKALSKAK